MDSEPHLTLKFVLRLFQLPGQGSHLPAVGRMATLQTGCKGEASTASHLNITVLQAGEALRLGWRMEGFWATLDLLLHQCLWIRSLSDTGNPLPEHSASHVKYLSIQVNLTQTLQHLRGREQCWCGPHNSSCPKTMLLHYMPQ